VTVKIDG